MASDVTEGVGTFLSGKNFQKKLFRNQREILNILKNYMQFCETIKRKINK
jgi:hypothetical protein